VTSLIGEAGKPAELTKLLASGLVLNAYRAETGFETVGLDTSTVSGLTITALAAT
jgi:hypothetical protein